MAAQYGCGAGVIHRGAWITVVITAIIHTKITMAGRTAQTGMGMRVVEV